MGREIVQASVSTRVRISPLTVLVARSGIGKSSFLTCRLIPTLQESSSVRYVSEWGGDTPQKLIAQALDSIGKDRSAHREKPVVVLDQFEDVFKLPNPRQPLWDQLAQLVNIDDSPVSILVSMREAVAWGLGRICRLPAIGFERCDQACATGS